MSIRPLVLAVLLLLGACGEGPLDLNLQVPSADGLLPGASVVLGDRVVGQVVAVELDPAGGYVARLMIAPEARDAATENSRFLVVPDPAEPLRRRIELKAGAPGSTPLAEGAAVRGTVEPAPLFPLGDMLRGLTEGLGSLRDQVERFRSELQRLPRSEEAKRLGEEWTRLREELRQAQEATEESVKKELVPKLRQELETLERKFRELDEAAKAKPRPI